MPGVLVKVRGDGQAFRLAAERSFGARAVAVEPILQMPPRPGDAALGLAPSGRSTWLRVQLGSAETATAWDQAHALLMPGQSFAAAGVTGVEAVEPDVPQGWLPEPAEKAADQAAFCAFDDQKPAGGRATRPGVAWNAAPPLASSRPPAPRSAPSRTKSPSPISIPASTRRTAPCPPGLRRRCSAISSMTAVGRTMPPTARRPAGVAAQPRPRHRHAQPARRQQACRHIRRAGPASPISSAAPRKQRSSRCASPTGWSASPPAPWCKASTTPAPRARRCCR